MPAVSNSCRAGLGAWINSTSRPPTQRLALAERLQHAKAGFSAAVVLDAVAPRERDVTEPATKCSISVVVPMPGSHATHTDARLPLHAVAARGRRRCASLGDAGNLIRVGAGLAIGDRLGSTLLALARFARACGMVRMLEVAGAK